MNPRRTFILLTISILFLGALRAAEKRDSLVVSLLTCWPGAEVYELCGHEALRIRSDSTDLVWDYGTFDFDQPNFVYRFVKGETDYMLTMYPTVYFLPEYVHQNRRVVEQELNLSQEEAQRLLQMMTEEAQPRNRVYRYNYVKDNCATRILERLDSAVGSPIIYPDTVKYGTFRNEMRAYHRDYPWYQFGIDMALGSGLDHPLRGREEMFVPLEMMEKAGGARLADGRPLVRETRVLNAGVADATLGATHWALTPLFWGWVLFILAVAACLWAGVLPAKAKGMKRGGTRSAEARWRGAGRAVFRTLCSLWFVATGIAGCVVAFLVFVSEHEASAPNLLLLWLNPLQLILGLGVWWRRTWRVPTIAMAYVNVILMIVLLIVWPMQTQSANPAFFPLMGVTLVLSLTYAIITQKRGYKINEEVRNLGAGRSGGNRRRSAKRPGASASGGRNRR